MQDLNDQVIRRIFDRSHLVNLNEIEKYIKGEGGYLVMSDGTSIDVARNKKETLLEKLLPYKE